MNNIEILKSKIESRREWINSLKERNPYNGELSFEYYQLSVMEKKLEELQKQPQPRQKLEWGLIRKQHGLSQREVGEAFGISKQAIWQFENGFRRLPIYLEIYYRTLRNTDEDKIIIKSLLERQSFIRRTKNDK